MGTEFIVGAIISTVLAGASTAVSVTMANQANAQARAMAEYQNRQRELAYAKSMAFNRASAQVRAAELKANLQMKYDLMRGASEAQGAERGTLESRVQDAVLNSLGYAATRESAKITTEAELGLLGQSINQQPQWVVPNQESVFLNGIQGGIQGFMNGINLAESINNMGAASTIAGIQQNSTGTGLSFGGGRGPAG